MGSGAANLAGAGPKGLENKSPAPLRAGDRVRFVSPASTPDRAAVEKAADTLRGWGLVVDFGPNAFQKSHYLAGTDDERLSDLNGALADPEVRAIFATRGGKGSYRIADRLDFAAARRDPKFLVGFSDITILHLALLKHGIGGGIHGALHYPDPQPETGAALRNMLTGTDDVVLGAQETVDTNALTTSGEAQGPLVGGNLDMIATAAGWALPELTGCILLLESVDKYIGEIDRQLTMLRKGGHLDGINGIALGQFEKFSPSGRLTILDLLADHLTPLGVPILGGLPLGHGQGAQPVPLGRPTILDTAKRELRISRP